jgi:hypothetical protein
MVRFLGFGITILEFVAPQLALKLLGTSCIEQVKLRVPATQLRSAISEYVSTK